MNEALHVLDIIVQVTAAVLFIAFAGCFAAAWWINKTWGKGR